MSNSNTSFTDSRDIQIQRPTVNSLNGGQDHSSLGEVKGSHPGASTTKVPMANPVPFDSNSSAADGSVDKNMKGTPSTNTEVGYAPIHTPLPTYSNKKFDPFTMFILPAIIVIVIFTMFANWIKGVSKAMNGSTTVKHHRKHH